MSVNISLIVLKEMYDILMILVDFFFNFPRFYLIFCYLDPDPAYSEPSYFLLYKRTYLALSTLLLRRKDGWRPLILTSLATTPPPHPTTR